jgi:hypothetical protein
MKAVKELGQIGLEFGVCKLNTLDVSMKNEIEDEFLGNS